MRIEDEWKTCCGSETTGTPPSRTTDTICYRERKEMDRQGMQSVVLLIFASFSVVYILNNSSSQGGPLVDPSTSSLSSVARSSSSSSPHVIGMETTRVATTLSGGELERRRRLLQSSGDYIGYGALSGDSVPCPPQSGRSYYTPDCQSASGPVNPYTRGCSTISRCSRN